MKDESVEKKGADTKATENFKIKLNYAIAELNNMQRELKETTSELNTKSSAGNVTNPDTIYSEPIIFSCFQYRVF